MFELFNTQTVDDPVKKGVEDIKKDQMYLSFWGLETVNFGNKEQRLAMLDLRASSTGECLGPVWFYVLNFENQVSIYFR